MSTQNQPSLYDRLGGVYSIATVVDDLIDRVMADPRLNANPAVDEAHHKVPPAGFKYLATEMVCWAAGGPQKYTGRSMADSHRHLNITPQEWEAFMADLQQTLDKFKVPAAEQVVSSIPIPGNDFYVFDGRLVVFLHYAGNGLGTAKTTSTASADIRLCRSAFDAVWELAVPHRDYQPV